MESSTQGPEPARLAEPVELQGVLANWQAVVEGVGIDLEQSAREHKAFQRKRELRSAGDLLRMVLCYALTNWSLRQVALWALLQGLAFLSDVAVLQRLRHTPRWLGKLIGQILQRRCQGLEAQGGVRLRLMDATGVSRPGSQGTDWRVHLSFDVEQMCVDGVEVTDAHGGESLARFPAQAHEIRVADAGYAFVRSLQGLLADGAGLVVRINWQNLVLETEAGARFPLLAWLKSLTAPAEQTVWLSTDLGRFALRLLACPLPPQAAEQARRRAHQRNAKKGRQVRAETLFAAGFVLLISNLPVAAWSLPRVFTLYRIRWQIELHFKRLKSLLSLDHLRAQDPRLAQAYLLGKLLAALLLDDLTQQVRLQQPAWFQSLERPLSVWRLTACLWEAFRHTILGPFSLARFFQLLPALRRYLCDSPRARPQQLAWIRALLEFGNTSPSCFRC